MGSPAPHGRAAVLSLLLLGLSLGQPMLRGQQAREPQPKRDAPTADQQSNDAKDVEITRKIRQAIVADTSLSTSAHNVTIVTVNGKVTLKGAVDSDAEKKNVQAKAEEVAGARNVANELTVSATSRKPSDTKQR